MNINSARALKAELVEKLVQPLLDEAPVFHSFSLAAKPMSKVTDARAGIALGIAQGARKKDYRLAVRLQRRTLEAWPDLQARFEKGAAGEVDLRYIGRLTKRQTPWHQERQRPLLIGCSTGHHRITAGTLGAFVMHQKSQKIVMLSNNHVFADEDRGKVGDDILQPGSYDGGKRPADTIGKLLDFVKLKTHANLVDAAIASIDEGQAFDARTLTGIGQLHGFRQGPVEPGDLVHKVGRTTGATTGRVTAIEVDDLVVGYDRGDLSFDRQIEIEGAGDGPFSAGGDSGSLIVDEDMRAFGLLFAGGDTGGTNGKGLTYANDLETVFQQLNITLAV